jgi:hypothetical protein
MYVQLDKEKPDIRRIYMRLELVAVKPMTVQVSNCPLGLLNKLMHRLLYIPALIDVPLHIRI